MRNHYDELGRYLPYTYLLGGSWVDISGVISRVTILTTHTRGLITLLITTHEPPSRNLWESQHQWESLAPWGDGALKLKFPGGHTYFRNPTLLNHLTAITFFRVAQWSLKKVTIFITTYNPK